MFNRKAFEECLKNSNVSKKQLAHFLNINEATLYRKISNDGSFERKEIDAIVAILKITDPMEIFFADNLA